MLAEAHSLPDDVAALKAMVLALQAELAVRDAGLRNRDLLIEKLKHQLAGLRRRRFGASWKALDQLELALEDEEIARPAGRALFADDTPVKRLAPGTGGTAAGRVWACVRDERPWRGAAAPAAGYRFSSDRKAVHPQGKRLKRVVLYSYCSVWGFAREDFPIVSRGSEFSS